tara:strand:+ start:35 stop:496 length:462 start_codon:yes stop_codon:yes gene_type:complete
MTSRWLKDDNNKYINGKNGKKLRYLFYKKTGQVQTTFDANWSDNSINILTEMFPDKVERVQSKRGRPKKSLVKKKEKVMRKVKRKKEKRLDQTAATVDTSDEEAIDDERSFDIDGYELVEKDGETYYKNRKDWMFNLEGDYIGHYNNGKFLKN